MGFEKLFNGDSSANQWISNLGRWIGLWARDWCCFPWYKNERVYKTNVKAKVLNEAKKINYGLFVLGNCITALINGKAEHIQYRNSALTKILKDSLGGNSKTSIIINISPSNYNTEETVSSLNFGHKAMSVQNRPIVNQANNFQMQSENFQDEYNKIMEKYKKLKIKYEKVVDENEQLKSTNAKNCASKNCFLLTTIILGVLLVAILFIPLFFILKSKKQTAMQPVASGGCPRCGYSVDLSKNKCPNCGTQF